MTPLGCPRCHDEKIAVESKEYSISTGKLDVKKYLCNQCGTRFFFEEDIYPIFMAAAKAPKG